MSDMINNCNFTELKKNSCFHHLCFSGECMIPGGSNSLISSNGCLTYHLPPRPCYCALIISSLYLFRPINVIQSKIYISKLFLFLFFSILFRLIMSCSLPLNKDLNEERNLTSIRILMGAGKCSL